MSTEPPRPLRLVLTPEQSAAIRESGMRFAVIHPDSYPSPTVGRWLVDLIECDQRTADAAVRVALGQARAVTIKKASGSSNATPPADAHPIHYSP